MLRISDVTNSQSRTHGHHGRLEIVDAQAPAALFHHFGQVRRPRALGHELPSVVGQVWELHHQHGVARTLIFRDLPPVEDPDTCQCEEGYGGSTAPGA